MVLCFHSTWNQTHHMRLKRKGKNKNVAVATSTMTVTRRTMMVSKMDSSLKSRGPSGVAHIVFTRKGTLKPSEVFVVLLLMASAMRKRSLCTRGS